MNRQFEELDRVLDRALDEIREAGAERQVERDAIERVGQLMEREATESRARQKESDRLRDCRDYQRLIPDYRAGRLGEARRLLVEDHLGECVTCRRALRDARPSSIRRAAESAASDPGWVSRWGWRAAAAAVVVVALFGLSIRTDIFTFETGGMIRIEAIEGEVLRVSDDGTLPLAVGQSLSLLPGETIRTAKGSAAVIRLADESQVEIKERTELAFRERRSLLPGGRPDGVIDLDRGSVIVEASDQGSGHLFLDTDACRVAVQGTVFAVNHGMKGSRVSVIEGEVLVDSGSGKSVLEPGEQVTTSVTLGRVPVEQEIAWSRNSGRYRDLLREVRALGLEIDAALSPDQRYSTELLDRAPADTVVYIAFPNISSGLDEAYRILEQRVASSDVLREWWDEGMARPGIDRELERIVAELTSWGGQFGEEIVLALAVDGTGEVTEPLLLARLTEPDGFEEFIAGKQLEQGSAGEGQFEIRLFEGDLPSASPEAPRSTLFMWRQGELVAAAPAFERVQVFARNLGSGRDLAGSGSVFYRRIAERYDRGVEWLFGVDLGRLIHRDDIRDETAIKLEELGLMDLQHLVAERREEGGRSENRAELTFDRTRRGAAAWLASPAPVGSLDFVSPDASLAAAFVMKDMEVVVDELLDFIGNNCEGFEQQLAEFERLHGISVREDIAAPLGGEFTLALDGPVLPVPSWKLVLEVYDPARLQQTMQWIVEQVNPIAEQAGRAGLRLDQERAGGREYFHLRSLDTGLGVHYVIEDGYLVAAASRTLIDRAIQNRSLGHTLRLSSRFAELLPRDGEVNFSAVVYQNLGPVVGALSRSLAEAISSLGGAVEPAPAGAEDADSLPSLAVLYGEPDRIVFVGTSEGGLFTSSLGSILGFGTFLNVQQSLIEALGQQAAGG